MHGYCRDGSLVVDRQMNDILHTCPTHGIRPLLLGTTDYTVAFDAQHTVTLESMFGLFCVPEGGELHRALATAEVALTLQMTELLDGVERATVQQLEELIAIDRKEAFARMLHAWEKRREVK